MNDLTGWAAVGAAAVANMGTWIVLYRGRNGKKKNSGNNPKPGTAQICQERGEKIAVIETKQKRFEQDIEEIKDDVRAIRQAVVK